VYRFNRVRYADERPMCLEYATVAGHCLPSLEAVDKSMYEALQRSDNRRCGPCSGCRRCC
jgi:GntR family transcriptional regulator